MPESSKAETAIYIHIPFCDHKCVYCDFYSIIKDDKAQNYFDALRVEIEHYAKTYSGNRDIHTIFFGGGTPSLVDEKQIKFVLDVLSANFNLLPSAEITLEANPGTLTPRKLQAYLSYGINRLSLGVQSFDENDLKFMTRIHTADIARSTIRLAKDEGFSNINLDLIFNLPGQNKTKWLYNLESAAELPVTHISAYSLMLEKGTILNKMVLDGKVAISDADYDADLYELTIEFLNSRGFHQYEVSNFAKEGFDCRHNKFYWDYKDYIGFGTSAHSFVNGTRWWNYNSLTFYLNSVFEKQHARTGEETMSPEEMINEYTMLALRSSGLKIKEFTDRFGIEWLERNEKLIRELLENEFMVRSKSTLKMAPKGYAVCDEILSRFN